MKIPDIKPDWSCGIYIGNGVVAVPKTATPAEKQFEVKKLESKIRKPDQKSVEG